MITENKLDKSFGPTGTSAGIFLFVIGIVTTFTSIFGLILVLLGSFIGFSSTSNIIDFDKRRVKFSNKLFGILKTGKWIQINTDMKLAIKDSAITWRTYSKGNRTLDIEAKDFRIFLLDSDNQEIMPIKKTNSFEAAMTELKILYIKLKLNAVE